ncbi:TadE family type IV pilus minor pilin [Cellulomonas sp. 179-A 4D5 NHS]|uniref:TadE family type IV pilus minor pilin n=1 Tax=Cellulomonas sp. 179-A 4D5 NHS TaxID=3142378 RepID=UPI0039A39E9F
MSSADGGDRGSVTAELAVALPAVVLVLVAVVVLAASALTQLRCADAARAGARAAAIGDDEAGVRATAARVAGAGADVSVVRTGDWVTVSVSDAVVSSGLRTGPLVARASAVAWVEP